MYSGLELYQVVCVVSSGLSRSGIANPLRMRPQTSISSLITCISGSLGSYGLLGEYAKMDISFAWASGAINTASGALTDKDTALNDFFSLVRCMGSLCCYRPTISRLRNYACAKECT